MPPYVKFQAACWLGTACFSTNATLSRVIHQAVMRLLHCNIAPSRDTRASPATPYLLYRAGKRAGSKTLAMVEAADPIIYSLRTFVTPVQHACFVSPGALSWKVCLGRNNFGTHMCCQQLQATPLPCSGPLSRLEPQGCHQTLAEPSLKAGNN